MAATYSAYAMICNMSTAVSATITPNAVLKPAFEDAFGTGQLEVIGNVNDTKNRLALSGTIIRGSLWTFVGYLAPPFDLKVSFRLKTE